MSTVDTAIVWSGPAEYRDLLTPVESLSIAPFNVRRGDMPLIADSLRRFGQYKPVVADAEGTILAGNNVYLAAVEMMGWSHVAVVEKDGLSNDDKMLLLLADNQASESGRTDPESALTVQAWLRARADSEETDDETAALLRGAADRLERSATRATPPVFPIVDPDGMAIEFCCAECGYEFSGGQS